MAKEIWKRAWDDWTGGNWLARSIAVTILGTIIGLSVNRLLPQAPIWLAGLSGAIGAALLWGFLTFVISLLKAPGKLLKERDEKIAAVTAELAAKLSVGIPEEVSRRVQRAIGALFDAYRVLEVVSNRTRGDAWRVLSQRLKEYKAAYALLPAIARRFHERSEPALTHFVRTRNFERLLESMNDASDIMLHGECELDLNISQPSPVIVTNRSSHRDRFILLNIIVANREDRAVSLFPVWQLYIDPGRVHLTYQADAEPLKDWEEHRREVPRPANPPLAMPLHLPPKSAATGYWCFFIGNSLENAKRLQGGRRYVETELEIHDLASGRRTKSDKFNLELEFIRSLLSPLPTDDNIGEENEEDGADTVRPPEPPS